MSDAWAEADDAFEPEDYFASVPKIFSGVSFETLDRSFAPDAFDACQAYVAAGGVSADNRPGLLLGGPQGTGKTSLAVAIMRAHHERSGGAGVRYVNISRTLMDARARGGRADAFSGLSEYSLVVFDDFGRQRVTDWVAEILYVVFDEVWSEMTRVVLTTNRTPQQLEETCDEAIWSRLRGMTSWVVVAGKDRRA